MVKEAFPAGRSIGHHRLSAEHPVKRCLHVTIGRRIATTDLSTTTNPDHRSPNSPLAHSQSTSSFFLLFCFLFSSQPALILPPSISSFSLLFNAFSIDSISILQGQNISLYIHALYHAIHYIISYEAHIIGLIIYHELYYIMPYYDSDKRSVGLRSLCRSHFHCMNG